MNDMARFGAIRASASKKSALSRLSYLQQSELNIHKANGALLMIDIRGRIVECNKSAARLLRQPLDHLEGQCISSVILDLPFATDTPYYNLAYAVFHADDDFEMERFAVTDCAVHIPITISVSSVVIKGRRMILLNLKAAKLNKENFS